MVLTQQQSEYLKRCYEEIIANDGLMVVPVKAQAEAVARMQEVANEEGYSLNINLEETYASTFPADERELVQNFRDRCVELSRTRHVQLHNSPRMQAIQEAGKNVGKEQLYILIEDRSRPDQNADPDDADMLSKYWQHSHEYILGHMVQYVYDDATQLGPEGTPQQWRCLDIVNHATVLKPDMFSMGGSNKRDKAYAAGHFGEGMKVQINRLISERKLDVVYTTGECALSFHHNNERHCQKQTLHMFSSPAEHHGHPSIDPSSMEETICSIRGPTERLPAVDNSKYLFLQPRQSIIPLKLNDPSVPADIRKLDLFQSLKCWYPCIRAANAAAELDIEFLLLPQFRGRFYIHGIFLKEVVDMDYKKEPELYSMGINYLGSTKRLEQTKLNRDRTDAGIYNLLVTLVPEVLGYLINQAGSILTDSKLNCLLAHLYLEMLKSQTALRGLAYVTLKNNYSEGSDLWQQQEQFHKAYRLMAQQLKLMLGPSVGLPSNPTPELHPCKPNASQSELAEVRLLGYEPVKVSNLLIEIWAKADLFKTMDELWDSRRDAVDHEPDDMMTWEDPIAQAEGEKLLRTLAGVLLDLGPVIGIPTSGDDSTRIDAWRKHLKVLHIIGEEFSHDNVVIPFRANREAGHGPLLVFEAEYLKSLDSVHKRLEAAGERCTAGPAGCGGECTSALLLQETSAALLKIGVNQSVLNKCVMKKAAWAMRPEGNNFERLGSQASTPRPHHSASPMDSANAAASASERRIKVVQAQKVGAGLCSNFEAPRDISACVAASLLAPAAPGKVCAQKRGPYEPIEIEEDSTTERDLCITDTKLGTATTFIPHVSYLYLPKDVVLTPQVYTAAQQLFDDLALLMNAVFSDTTEGSESAAPDQNSFYVFYDPERSAVAFNRDGQLWFNAAVRVDPFGHHNARVGLMRFWFLVCCHELSHNKVKYHTRRFSDLCSSVVLHYAPKFHNFLKTLTNM